MSISSKGRQWRTLHSLWILFTLFLGFLGWISFIYIGFRVKCKKWILCGFFYFLPPFLYLLMFDKYQNENLFINTSRIVIFIFGVISIVHAFLIRKEYLIGLEKLQELKTKENNIHSEIVSDNNDVIDNKRSIEIKQSKSIEHSEDVLNSNIMRDEKSVNTKSSLGSKDWEIQKENPSYLDVNKATETELLALPSISLIHAKKAIKLREENGGFRSIDEFMDCLLFKPHIAEKIKPLLIITKFEKLNTTQNTSLNGRIIDY